MRVQDQLAYILHQRPFRDSSLILELFTPDYGRLSVVGKGCASSRSKTKSVLRAFQPLVISWSGKGEMPTLVTAEPLISQVKIPALTGDSLLSGFYINELILRLLHKHDVHENVFSLYQNVLQCLTDNRMIEICLRIFEKNLLQFLGFEINLTIDADSGKPVSPTKDYIYYIEHGPVEVSFNNEANNQLKIDGSSLLAFSQEDLADEKVRKQVKSLTRYILAYYLGDKPLKSRELFI
ncbi:MAG: DNA repair protein RecO [Gammaproteobacteria bacterium]|nr:DNA repair protein RecO [Gammaproteobacteria bacterium]